VAYFEVPSRCLPEKSEVMHDRRFNGGYLKPGSVTHSAATLGEVESENSSSVFFLFKV
jgi:hypothetical protein